jgi:carboxypeptidase C (cathepsin A)
MKHSRAIVLAALAATTLICGAAGAQTPASLPAQNFYYDDSAWPLPAEGATTALRLTGMTSAHAVWMTFSRFEGGKPVTDSPVIVLLEGSTVKWNPPGGCSHQLQLVNSNPPQINMTRPSSMCALNPGTKVIFKILALP